MVALLGYAVTIYTLPVSLFGMSISAAELPEMSSVLGDESQIAAMLRARLNAGLRRIAFFVIPSAAAFLVLGDVIARALFQSGRFTETDTVFTWGILAGSAVGLLASTLGRLYSSTYYALHDTRTPLRFAIVRVTLTTVLGYLFAIPLPRIARNRSALGRGWPHGLSGHRWLDRVPVAAVTSESAHRRDGLAEEIRRHALAVRGRLPLALRSLFA